MAAMLALGFEPALTEPGFEAAREIPDGLGLEEEEGEEVEEEDELDEEVLLSTNLLIPNPVLRLENQFLKNFKRKSVFTFSPLASALIEAWENLSFILKLNLFLTMPTTVAFSSRKDASLTALANDTISCIS